MSGIPYFQAVIVAKKKVNEAISRTFGFAPFFYGKYL